MLVISAPRLPEGWSISAASQTETATGDIAGVRSRLSYLAQLGVDAIWINPWYRSPMADAGYDAADFRNIDPSSVTLAEAEALIEEAHRHGIKVIPDIIPNHTSDQHPWFRSALCGARGARERCVFGPGAVRPVSFTVFNRGGMLRPVLPGESGGCSTRLCCGRGSSCRPGYPTVGAAGQIRESRGERPCALGRPFRSKSGGHRRLPLCGVRDTGRRS
jgi:hypothetical protein